MRSSTGSTNATHREIRNEIRNEGRQVGRRVAQVATRQVIEQLEGRQMLAANPFDFRNVPNFTASTSNINNVKDGPLAKGGGELISLYNEYSSYVKKGGNRYNFNSSQADQYAIVGRNVLMTIRTRGSVDSLVAQLKEMGSVIVYRSKAKRVVDAFVPLNQVQNLASRSEILHLRPQLKPKTNSQGSVSNDAERSEKTQFASAAFGVDGSNTTVGVLSDSYGSDAADVASGDLPDDVKVLADQPGTDEGRAMLQLIHDLAPGADLQFSTVGASQNTFADGIRNLREAGSDVIVDDVGFFDEPFFQEGVIDRAIDDVNDDGATYFTANGNAGFAGFATTSAHWVNETGSDNTALDFDASKNVDTKLDVRFNRGGTLFFQWDNPYDGVVGDVSADVDFYVYRNGTLISSGVDDNFVTGVPVEHITIPEGGDYEIVIRLANLEKGATAPTTFGFVSEDNDMFDSRKDVEYGGYHTTAIGHTAAQGAIPVGAVDNAASSAFGTARDLASQDFSSAGPQVRVFDANGNRLDSPEVRLTPIVSGIQGTNTTQGPSFAPFFGTSAAAPNVAAIAALILDGTPDASPDAIKEALIASAKSNPLNGQKAGTYDSQAGYGLVDAVAALARFNHKIPVSRFTVDSRSTSGSLGSITVNFSEPVTGVDLSDFTLTRDGTSVNRFTGSETVTASNNNQTYTIENLKSATSTLGTYTIMLRDARTDIVDVDGHVAAGNVTSFDVTLRKPGNLVADSIDNGQIRLRWTDTNTAEDNYRIQRASDAAFSLGIRNIDVGANKTTYTDTDVVPGEVYYYRVRAAKSGRLGDVARVVSVASSAGEIFVDDKQAKLNGGWATYADDNAFLQSYSRASATPITGENANTATFSAPNVATGSYFIYTQYTSGSKSASNASYQILHDGKLLSTVKIDQTTRGNGWVLLGKFASTGPGSLSVRLTSAGANGSVTADAVRFLPADAATIEAFQSQKKKSKKKTSAAADVA